MLLIVTIGLTAWTAMRGEDSKTTAEIVVVNKLTKSTIQHKSAQVKDVSSDTYPSLDILQKLKREPTKVPVQELFGAHSWFVPPPVKKLLPIAQPAPAAPPLPYIYSGKLEGTPQGTLIFLMANNKLYTATKGQNVDQLWRLDTENDNMLRFTYLPLNLPKILLKSASSNAATTHSALALAAQNNQPTD